MPLQTSTWHPLPTACDLNNLGLSKGLSILGLPLPSLWSPIANP